MAEFNLRQSYLETKKALFDKYYEKLNDKQREAVYHINGPLLILAGAGSGKTTVLVNRLAYMIRYGNAYNSDLCQTDVSESMIDEMKSGLLPVWKQTIIFQIIKKAVAVAITSTYQP